MNYQPRYWSTPVNPPSRRGDHAKTQYVGDFLQGWSPGQPQFAFYRVTKKKESGKNAHQYKEISRFGVDRVTTPGVATPPAGDFWWSPLRDVGLTTPDHPAEVTL